MSPQVTTIPELFSFLQANMVTKEEMASQLSVLKKELNSLGVDLRNEMKLQKEEILTQVRKEMAEQKDEIITMTGEMFEHLKTDILTITTRIDRFLKLHETLDTEVVAVRGKYDRLDDRLTIVERKLASVSL